MFFVPNFCFLGVLCLQGNSFDVKIDYYLLASQPVTLEQQALAAKYIKVDKLQYVSYTTSGNICAYSLSYKVTCTSPKVRLLVAQIVLRLPIPPETKQTIQTVIAVKDQTLETFSG